MPKHEYLWQVGAEPPQLEPHSRAKHRIIEAYLKHYVRVRWADPRHDVVRLTLVDGFAGGGHYRDPTSGDLWEGSPLRMLRAMREVEAELNAHRERPARFDVDYHFVEQKREVAEYLRGVLARDEHQHGHGQVNVLDGDFITHLPALLERASAKTPRAGRAIFVLDQYGYKDVPLPLVRQIFAKLPSAEVILTFATDWLLDYMADTPEFRTILERTGLAGWSDTLPELLREKDRAGGRQAIQALLYRDLWSGSGARYFTPFFIRSAGAHRDYWLVHLSGHEKAHDVMTELHWREQNKFAHFGRSGLHMLSILGYDPALDPDVTGQLYAFTPDDKATTKASITAQLAGDIAERPDGVRFGDWFREHCNFTTATRRDLISAILKVAHGGEIEIYDGEGAMARRTSGLRDEDILRVPRQSTFDFARRRDR